MLDLDKQGHSSDLRFSTMDHGRTKILELEVLHNMNVDSDHALDW